MAGREMFYVKRLNRDGKPSKGKDKSGDTFGVFFDGWNDPNDTEPGSKKPFLLNAIGGSLGARQEAERLCSNLNLAWRYFHQGVILKQPGAAMHYSPNSFCSAECGALGDVSTTNIKEAVTCSTCLGRLLAREIRTM